MVRKRLPVYIVALALCVISSPARAWKIKNHTKTKFKVTAVGGDILNASVTFPKDLSPGDEWFCDHDLLTGDGRCYNAGTGATNASPRVRLDVAASNGRTFACDLSMPRNGRLDIYEERRDVPPLNFRAGYPPNYYCVSKNANGVKQDESNTYGVGATNRDVRFLASGDPQMDNGPALSQGRAARTQSNMLLRAFGNPQIRGIIVAGDLTMNTRINDEFFWYRFGTFENIGGSLVGGLGGGEHPLFFEGLGNHDIFVPDSLRAASCLGGLNACMNPRFIRNFVRNKHRATPLTGRDGQADRLKTKADNYLVNVTSESCQGNTCKIFLPNYSWDWHDVHFAMLNIIPGEGNFGVRWKPQGPTEGDDPNSTDDDGPQWYYDHLESLAFLRSDLNYYVGNSGRPVVLVHHVGLDSLADWDPGEREAYWDVIDDYNVIAIITGHIHIKPNSPRNSWHYSWARPVTSSSGPEKIDTFNAAASHLDAYLDVTIDDEKMILQRKDYTGSVKDSLCKLVCPNQRDPQILIPADVSAECSAVPAPPPPGSVTATDACGVDVSASVSFNEVRIDGSCDDQYTLERTWSITDACGVVTAETQVIEVNDTIAPVVHTDPQNTACLWPPNHKYNQFGGIRDMVGVTDNCDPGPTVASVSCASNQCDDAPCSQYPGQFGDGSTVNDCRYDWSSDLLFARAERAQPGDGRTYSVSYAGVDRCSNESAPVVGFAVDVPSNMGSASECIEAGPASSSTDLVLAAETVSWLEHYEACNSITAGPFYEVVDPGELTLKAGHQIVLRDGFSIGSGPLFSAGVDSSLVCE